MTRTHPCMGGRRGQSLVEFALVVPILLLMLVGIIEFGRAWNVSQTVTDAARQGARIAAVLSGRGWLDPEITDSVDATVAASLLNGAHINCNSCVENIVGAGVRDAAVTVTVAVPYQFMLLRPFMALANDGLITLRSGATMRNE